jgi:hypothetical protein
MLQGGDYGAFCLDGEFRREENEARIVFPQRSPAEKGPCLFLELISLSVPELRAVRRSK